MTDLFGRYESQTTRGLAQIQSSKYPDTDKDFEANLHRLNQFVDYIAQYLQTMQKGVDQATTDPIRQIRNVITDMGALLAGGQLLFDIDLGDLQYYLPALAAMFGFDADQPFPINLLYAAEHFFLGYIIPLDAWTFAVQDIIDAWAIALGLDPDFIESMHELLAAIQDVTDSFTDLFHTLADLLGIFGIPLDGSGTGAFAELWHSVTQILGAFDLQTLGNLTDPVLHAAAPWISELAHMISLLADIIDAFSGGTQDIQGMLNFADMFTSWVDFLPSGGFDPTAALKDFINGGIKPTELLVSAEDVLGNGGWPYEWPIVWSTPNTMQGKWFQRLREMLGTDLTRPDFDIASALEQFINNSLLPRNLLAPLINGRLPDAFAPLVVQNMIDEFAKIFLGLTTVNNGFPLLQQALRAIFGGYTGAQSSATTAASTATAALAATSTPVGGVTHTDFFDYAAGAVSTPYVTRYVGGGASGTLVWDGAGKLDWSIAGGITRQGFFVDTANPTATDTQEITVVFDRVVEAPSGGDESYNYVLGRANNTATSYTAGRVGHNSAQIVYDTGTGFINVLGSPVTVTPAPGDIWKLKCGVGGTARRFVLQQNGVTVLDVTDTTNTILASTNRYGGGAMQAGARNYGSTQTKPANYDSITIADAA